MKDIERLIIESAVRRTVAAYCQTCDDGRFDEFAECFAKDAVVAFNDREIVGRDAIREWITAAMPAHKRGRHVTQNVLVDVRDEKHATAAVDFFFLARTPDGPRISTAGRYLDEFGAHDGRWVFTRREITFLQAPTA